MTDEEIAKMTETEAKQAWENSPAIREEFQDMNTFLGYWAAAREGVIKPFGRGRRKEKEEKGSQDERGAAKWSDDALRLFCATSGLAKDRWNQHPELRAEFQSPGELHAYAAALARGCVKKLARSA